MENAGSNKHLSKKQERHLLRLGRKLMLDRHPNPQRLGCPSKNELKVTAVNRALLPQTKVDSVVDHITLCSPCFREFSRYRRNARFRKRLPVLLTACGFLVLVTALAGAYIARIWRQQQPNMITRVPPRQPAYQAIAMDLRTRSPLRSDESQAQRQAGPPLRLPWAPVDLSIYLPIGSDGGRYTIQILRRDQQPLLTAEGDATMQDNIMVLHVQLNFQQIAPGDYFFALREATFPWSYYPLKIK